MRSNAVKILVMADTHIHKLDELPAEIVQIAKTVDLIIHLGDFVRTEIIDYLRSTNDFCGIAGNHDPRCIKSILPRSDMVEVNGKKLGLIHGYWFPLFCQQRYEARFKKDDVDAILYGHTHVIRNEKVDNKLFFNPGSVTARYPAPWKTYGILDVGESITGQVISFAEKEERRLSRYTDTHAGRQSIIRWTCGSPREPDYSIE